jgi:hypothetical protein
MDENESPKKIWTNPGVQRGLSRQKSRWIVRVEEDARKLGCRDLLATTQDKIPGDICLRRPRPTQDCRVDDNDDDAGGGFFSVRLGRA